MASNPGRTLQDNASNFFDKVFSAHQGQMRCAAGCDACCYTSFSLFSWEAELVTNWFIDLSLADRENLKQLWSINPKMGVDAHGKEQLACPFLFDGKCTIYPVRPLICRTQGLPLLIDQQLASCPLNFQQRTPDKAYWLDLERLNTLSSLLQNTRADQNRRIELSVLRSELTGM